MKAACHDEKTIIYINLRLPLSLPLWRILITAGKVLASSAPCIEFLPLNPLIIEEERLIKGLVGRFEMTRWRHGSEKASTLGRIWLLPFLA